MPEWTADDLKAWRARLRWTQARAAEALLSHPHAYKNWERGMRPVCARTAKLAVLVEREHVRAMFSTSGSGIGRQLYSTADRAVERMKALESDGKLVGPGGRRKLRYLSLFSGIEACTAAFERLGADVVSVGFAETDAAANSVLRYRWPDVPRLGDVTDVDWSMLRGHVDLVVGGSPCQSFSVAGKRLGISDPRGNLALHFLRAVAAVQPRWFLFENVPGLLASGSGEDFGVFLDEVEKCGYACSWRILDAVEHGLPQRRQRLFVVGEHSRSASGPREILALNDGESGNSAAGRQAWKAAAHRSSGYPDEVDDIDWAVAAAWLEDHGARAAAARPAANDDAELAAAVGDVLAFQPMAGARARTVGASATVTPTLGSASGSNRVPAVVYAADMRHCTLSETETSTLQRGSESGWSLNAMPCVLHPDGGGRNVARRFTPGECLRLQGFDDGWLDGVRCGGKPLSDSDKYRLIGNSWAVPCAARILERLLAVHQGR